MKIAISILMLTCSLYSYADEKLRTRTVEDIPALMTAYCGYGVIEGILRFGSGNLSGDINKDTIKVFEATKKRCVSVELINQRIAYAQRRKGGPLTNEERDAAALDAMKFYAFVIQDILSTSKVSAPSPPKAQE